jgi:hypothetical protein
VTLVEVSPADKEGVGPGCPAKAGKTVLLEVVGDRIDSRETAVLFRGRLFDAVAEEISVVTHASEKMSLAHSVSVQIAVTRAL